MVATKQQHLSAPYQCTSPPTHAQVSLSNNTQLFLSVLGKKCTSWVFLPPWAQFSKSLSLPFSVFNNNNLKIQAWEREQVRYFTITHLRPGEIFKKRIPTEKIRRASPTASTHARNIRPNGTNRKILREETHTGCNHLSVNAG